MSHGAIEAISSLAPTPPLKVAFVLVDLYCFDSVSTTACEQAIVLSEAGLDIDLICNNLTGIDAEFIKSRDIFRPDNYDLIVYHYYIGDPLLDAVLCSDAYKIVYYHGITTPPELYAPYSPDFVEICKRGLGDLHKLHLFDYVITSSNYNISQIKDHTPDGHKDIDYSLCPPIVSISRFQLQRQRKSGSTINILTVGRIFSSKNIEGVIKFASYVRKLCGKPVKLTVAGSKCVPAYIADLLSIDNTSQDIELNISLRPSDENLRELYREADIFTSFSHHEGFCIPLVEAMASRTVVVSHAVTAISETMAGTGIIVAPYEYQSAAELAVNTLSHKEVYSSIIREQMLCYRNKYSESVIVANVIGIFLDIINKKNNVG